MNQTPMFQSEIQTAEVVKQIHTLRDQKVILDTDLARIYEVETKQLKRQVRRNIARFPEDFMFELTETEIVDLRCQNGTSKLESDCGRPGVFEILRSNFGTSNVEDKFENRGGVRYAPFAFTELGVAMLSSVLNSERAIQVNISIMRAFVQLRASPCEEQPKADSGIQLELLEKRCDALERKLEKLTTSLARDSFSTNPSQNTERVLAIQNAVALHWGITVDDLKSADRSHSFTLPRHIAIYLVRNHLGLSLNEIGRHFGGRDHATILSALRKVEHLSSINSMIDSLTSSIH